MVTPRMSLNACIAWDSNGSLRVAPGISAAVRVTETGHEELHVGSWSPVDIADITRVLATSSLCYILRRIVTPHTLFRRAKTAAFGNTLLNRIYGTDRTLEAHKVRAQGFLCSLQYISWWPDSNRM